MKTCITCRHHKLQHVGQNDPVETHICCQVGIVDAYTDPVTGDVDYVKTACKFQREDERGECLRAGLLWQPIPYWKGVL